MPKFSPRQRAENAAHNVSAHFFGVALAESDLFAERCAAQGVTVAGVNLQDCVLEPLFFGRIILKAAGSKMFSDEAAQVFDATTDRVFMGLFSDAFLDRKATEPRIPPLLDTFYRETAAVRSRQYELCRSNLGLRLYRFVKGSTWFDALFLSNVLRKDFSDKSLMAPDEPLEAFATAVVKDARTHAEQIRDDGYSFVVDTP